MNLSAERDFYRALVEIDEAGPPEVVVDRALRLAVEAVGARLGYLAIGSDLEAPSWTAAAGLDEEELREVRTRISHGVLREAARVGGVFVTHDAGEDSRFRDRASVRRNRIEQVVCAALPSGVLYLQGSRSHLPLGEDELRLVQAFVRVVGPLGRRLADAHRRALDPTRVYRERLDLDGLVGRSAALARVFEGVHGLTGIDEATVLILGPSGSGKTALAGMIHRNSVRSKRPFYAVNCAMLTGDLVRVELFGATPGSYTGQKGPREGLVEAAHGGTLFLDEVGALSAEAQAQLLTFLQDGEYTRLGEHRARRANVRVIAATWVELLNHPSFRKDLYWRLAGIVLKMPSIAERLGDLPELCATVVARLAAQHKIDALPLTPGALAWLEARPWPGNVRELENEVFGAMLRARVRGESALRASHFTSEAEREAPTDLHSQTQAFQRRRILQALHEAKGNKTIAAEMLGLHRTTLYDLIARLELDDGTGPLPPQEDGPG